MYKSLKEKDATFQTSGTHILLIFLWLVGKGRVGQNVSTPPPTTKKGDIFPNLLLLSNNIANSNNCF